MLKELKDIKIESVICYLEVIFLSKRNWNLPQRVEQSGFYAKSKEESTTLLDVNIKGWYHIFSCILFFSFSGLSKENIEFSINRDENFSNQQNHFLLH